MSRAFTRRTFLAGVAAIAPCILHAAEPGRMVFITPQGYRLAFAQNLVGVAGGYYKAQGLDVQVIGGTTSPQAVQQTLAGQALCGCAAGITVLNAVAKGGGIKAIATVAHGSPFFMISTGAKPVRSAKDLVGGTVGLISANGASENTLDAMLLGEGVDPKSVTRQYTGDNPGAYALLEAGRLRAFVGAIDTYLRAKATHSDVAVLNMGEAWPLPGQMYLATDASIATQRDTLAAFLRGTRAAIEAIVADTDKSRTLDLVRTFPVEGAKDEALAKAILDANQELWMAAGPDNILRNIPADISRGVELAAKAGFATAVAPEKMYTNELFSVPA